MSDNPILDVHCQNCGAAVLFDIKEQVYNCRHCGTVTPTTVAVSEKKGFRELHREKMQSGSAGLQMSACSCRNCGAEVIFPESEAMTQCAFCAKALVRKDYSGSGDLPELLIPFYLTRDDAVQILDKWCSDNASIKEAKIVSEHVAELKGFYLPYELARGPVKATVARNSSKRIFNLRGFVDGIFVNSSKELDNLLLDGMEPYDLSGIKEMDFSYLAGSAVKVRDIDDKQMIKRISEEIDQDYEGFLYKPMESRAICVDSKTEDMMIMSALLPVYYLRVQASAGVVLAAVNGQTGKVAVREMKDRFLLPWWIAPLLTNILLLGAIFGVTTLISGNPGTGLFITGMLSTIFIAFVFAIYSDFKSARFRLRRRVFTTPGGRYIRKDDTLVQESEPLTGTVDAPAFYEDIGGESRKVTVRFCTFRRRLVAFIISLAAVFLPYIIAFAINDFSAKGMSFSGGAVWLCLVVPLAPIFFLRYRVNIYEKPWFYEADGEGQSKRIRVRRTKDSGWSFSDLRYTLLPYLVLGLIIIGLLAISIYIILGG